MEGSDRGGVAAAVCAGWGHVGLTTEESCRESEGGDSGRCHSLQRGVYTCGGSFVEEALDFSWLKESPGWL